MNNAALALALTQFRIGGDLTGGRQRATVCCERVDQIKSRISTVPIERTQFKLNNNMHDKHEWSLSTTACRAQKPTIRNELF